MRDDRGEEMTGCISAMRARDTDRYGAVEREVRIPGR
jgi:hypothetical protein